MKLPELESVICKVLAKNLGFQSSQVTPTSNIYTDLGADSLDIVEVIMAIEEELKIEIPYFDGDSLGNDARSVALRLVELNLITLDETEHERLLRTDQEYAKNFEKTTIPEGTRFSVVFDCVNREESAAFKKALHSNGLALVSGCQVLAIVNSNVVEEYSTLKQKLQLLLEKDPVVMGRIP